MAAIVNPDRTIATEPVIIPWWTWIVFAVALLGSYLMLQENGLITSHWLPLHELFHDGRHALGLPCH